MMPINENSRVRIRQPKFPKKFIEPGRSSCHVVDENQNEFDLLLVKQSDDATLLKHANYECDQMAPVKLMKTRADLLNANLNACESFEQKLIDTNSTTMIGSGENIFEINLAAANPICKLNDSVKVANEMIQTNKQELSIDAITNKCCNNSIQFTQTSDAVNADNNSAKSNASCQSAMVSFLSFIASIEVVVLFY